VAWLQCCVWWCQSFRPPPYYAEVELSRWWLFICFYMSCISIAGVRFLMWCHTCTMVTMTSALRSCSSVRRLPASPPSACNILDSLYVLQFLMHRTFIVVFTELACTLDVTGAVADSRGNYCWSSRRWLLLQVRHITAITRLLQSGRSHEGETTSSYYKGCCIWSPRRWFVWHSCSS